MLVVGLTGGIATGKSSVSSLLKSHGVPVIDADVLARQVVLPGTRGHAQIIATFGSSVLLPDGTIDRSKLGTQIFNDKSKREKLNAIVHPAVRRAMVWGVLMCWLKGERFCVLDVPLLVEVGLWKWMGKVVVVFCPEDMQLQRLMTRDKSPKDAAMSRIQSQMSISDKVHYADRVIDNSGTLQDLETQVSNLLQQLKSDVKWTWRLSWILPPFGIALGFWTVIHRLLRHKARKAEFHKQ